MSHRDRIFLTLLLIALMQSARPAVADDPVPEARVLNWMRELDPLPKVHYSWPLPWKSLSEDVLFEYVRLTRAASISGEWSTQEIVERAVAVCRRVNESEVTPAASIGINFSPWHRRFGKDLPATETGPSHQAELDYFRERAEFLRSSLDAANARGTSPVEATCLMFDSERFHTRPDDSEWNRALTQKYNAIYEIARELFPDVRIEWYARGAIHPSASSSGWSEQNHFTLDERGESFGCSLYRVPEIEITRSTFRRTAAHASEHGCDQVTPWIALASGYRRQTETFHKWSYDWNYDLIYSWQLGLEINNPWFGVEERAERFAPWERAKIAIFYPEPFGRTPHWGQHFVAYVRGAHHIRTLPEVD